MVQSLGWLFFVVILGYLLFCPWSGCFGLFVVLSPRWLFWAVCGSVAGVVFVGLFVASPCENGEEHYSDRYVHDHQTGYDKKQRGWNPVTAGPDANGYKRLEGM